MAKNLGVFFLDAEQPNLDGTGNHSYTEAGTIFRSGTIKHNGNYSYGFTADTNTYIRATDHGDFHFGTGDFTFDCWFQRTETNGHDTFMNLGRYGTDGNNTLFYVIDFGTQHNIYFLHPNGTGNFPISAVEPSGFFQNNTWYHVAVTRKDGWLHCFLNGVEIGTPVDFTYADVKSSSGYGVTIGAYGDGNNNPFNGYIDNFRIVKGQALWENNFELDDFSLKYKNIPFPVSNIYDIGHRGNLRGRGNPNFIRPTLKQLYTSTPNWKERVKSVKRDIFLTPVRSAVTSNMDLTLNLGEPAWNGAYIDEVVTEGKWYIEYKLDTTGSIFAGIWNPDDGEPTYDSPGTIWYIGNYAGGSFSVVPDSDGGSSRYYTGTPTHTFGQDDYVSVCWDFDTATATYYVNGEQGDSFTHEVLGASILSKVSFYVLGYPGGRQFTLTPNEDSVQYPIPGYEYLGKIIEGPVEADDNFDSGILNTQRWDNVGDVPIEFNAGMIGGTDYAQATTDEDGFYLKHKGTLEGNFDVQTKLSITSINTLGFWCGINILNTLEIYRNGAGIYARTNGNGSQVASVASHPMDIYLRATRTGSTGQLFYGDDGENWTLLRSYTVSTNDVPFYLSGGCDGATGNVTFWFDDVKFNIGRFTDTFI